MDTIPKSQLRIWREARELTLEAAAALFGLDSKGYLSELERGGKCSVTTALNIEQATSGEICAAALSPDVALVRQDRSPTPTTEPGPQEAAA